MNDPDKPAPDDRDRIELAAITAAAEIFASEGEESDKLVLAFLRGAEWEHAELTAMLGKAFL